MNAFIIMKLTRRLIIALLVSGNALLAMQTPYTPDQLAERQVHETELNNPQSLVNCKPELIEPKKLVTMAGKRHLHEYILRYLDKGVRIPYETDAKILCERLLIYSNDDNVTLLATVKYIQRKGPALSRLSFYRLLYLSFDTPICTQLLLDMAGSQLENRELSDLLKSGVDDTWYESAASTDSLDLAYLKKRYSNRSKYCALLINAGAQVPPLEQYTAKLSAINASYLSTLLHDCVQLKELNASLPLFHQNPRLFFNKVPSELIKELKNFIFEMLTTRTVSDWWRTSGCELKEKNKLEKSMVSNRSAEQMHT